MSTTSGYDIWHRECAQWHAIPATGVVTCETTGDKFEIADSDSGLMRDSDEAERTA